MSSRAGEVASLREAFAGWCHALLIATSIAVAGCAGQPGERFVFGSEHDDLLIDTNGTIVAEGDRGGIAAVSLPTLHRWQVRADREGTWIHSVSAADEQGRIAFVEDFGGERRHQVVASDLYGGPESVICERAGDASWTFDGMQIGGELELSRKGGLLAFVADLEHIQLGSGEQDREYVARGRISIWDIETKRELSVSTTAIDDRIQWDPNTERLVFTDLVDIERARSLSKQYGMPSDYAPQWMAWRLVPVVVAMDVRTGAREELCVGSRPVVSPSGTVLIVSDSRNYWMYDLESRFAHCLSLEGVAGAGIVEMTSDSVVLAWSWPTKGIGGGKTDHNSPLVGPKPLLSLKLVNVRSGEFQTILPFVDPRHKVSFSR